MRLKKAVKYGTAWAIKSKSGETFRLGQLLYQASSTRDLSVCTEKEILSRLYGDKCFPLKDGAR